MAGASENIKFSEIADNEITASENIYFTPILTVTPEKSTTVNAIWNEETPNQVDFDGVGDYLTIEDQTIEHISYDNTGTVYFTNRGSHNTVGPGNVLSVVSNWSGYAVGHNAIEYSEDSYVGVEWNTVRMTSGHQYSMVGFRTADDGRSLNTTDAYKNMSYSVYTVDRSSTGATNMFDVRNQWQPGSDRSSTTGNNNTLQNIYVTDSFDPSAKIKMVVNPSTKKVELWHAGVRRYEFSFPLTAASYPINVWTNVYKGKVENIKIINEKQQFNNYISDKCWTFNCWIRIPAAQTGDDPKYILDINDVSITGGKVYLVGLKNNTQLYACEGGTTNKEYFGTNISADEWHMLTISQKPQETTTIYNPPYEYHSTNSLHSSTISTGCGQGQLDSPLAWCMLTALQTNNSTNSSYWYQLQLPNVQKVFGAITQGRYSTATTYQHVTKWKFKYSKDNIIWIDVDGGAEFVGNTDSNTKVYQTFTNPVLARYIRFYPQTYYGHASARMGLSVEPLPGHISVYLDGQKDTGASQGVNDNYISVPSSAKWSIGSGFSVATGTQITGPYIGGGSKPVTHVLNLGNNIWIVGVIDSPHLKMIKIEITGENTYNYVATRYTTGTTSACTNPSTFSEACFIGTESSNGTYVVNLVTGGGPPFKGSAKEIMIWGKGLSDYEIAALHKLGHKNVGQTDIIEEDAVFTSSAGDNIVTLNSVRNINNSGWGGWATTDEDSSIVGIKYQLIDTTANVMIGLLTGGEMISSALAYQWKGWKTYRPPHTSMLQSRYAPDGYNMTPVSEDSYTTNIQTVTTQTVKFIINEDTNYPEIYIDDNLVHTFTNRTINISDYPFACAVNCSAGGVKNVKVLKRTISQRYLHNEEPFNPVFDPPYTHHSSPWIINGEDPGENRVEGRGRLSGNGAWIPAYDTGAGSTWASSTHVNSNNETYYYQIDYSADGNDKIPIAGVVTYGRYGSNQWVTKWKFKYFNGSTWEWVDDGYEFDGNTHNDQRNSVYFDGPVDTTGIRFFPTEYSSYPSARMALLLYKPNAPLYAIVDGHGGISNVNHVGWGISQVISAQLGYWGTSYGSQPTCMRITTDSHSLDFSMHPGYSNGQARVEYANNGASILGNQSMGWTPAGNQYHTYFVTMRLNGTHTFGITDADGVRTWSKDFSLSNWSSLNIEVALSCEGSFVTASIPVGGSAEFTRNGQHQLQSLLINLNRYNNTWLFNGNNYLRLEGLLATITYNNRSFVGKTNISFSCWFYKINQGTEGDVIYSCHDGTTNRYMHRVNLDGSLMFYVQPVVTATGYGIDKWITRPGFIQTQKWYHYAFTRNGTTFTFYINGKKVSDDDIVTHEDSTTKNPLINQVSHSYTTNYRFSIGQEWDSIPSNHWKGKISNIYFWDRTLTGDEIYSVYHNFGVSKSEFAGKLLMDNTIIPEASDNANISISSYFKDKQFQQLIDYPFSFTNCGATGQNGPTLTQCVSEYSNSLSRINMTTQGIQEWTVPKSGVYKISAKGGRGGHGGIVTKAGGLGAIIEGIFNLQAGEIIKILVGQKGQEYGDGLGQNIYAAGGGGGGTFVLKSPYNSVSSVLIIAGGGGGSNHHGNNSANAAQDINARLPNETGTGGGGVGGYTSGGGGGLITNGGDGNPSQGSGGKSFVNEGQGGIGGYLSNRADYRNYGGFGGGGGNGAHSGGGGGGINGGDAFHYDDYKGAEGGASYNTGESQLSQHHSGSHGEVTITLMSFHSHTFTNCGATGNNGPTLANCISEYYSASWASNTDLFNMTTQGIQEWTVPKSGRYNIIAKGGRGGHGGSVAKAGGLGAIIEGIFNLQRGEIIKILVGQKGQEYGDGLSTTAGAAGGGGGGTFVLKSPYNSVSSVLIIAGGGGGSNHHGNVAANAAQDINARLPNETGTGGGSGGNIWASGGGGGLITDGYGSTYSTGSGGKSFVNEGQGGIGGYSSNNSTYRNYGGFGGGAGNGAHTGGGGGGINGGDARNNPYDYNDYKGAEGGASYNTGTEQVSQHHSGSHGTVTITLL